MVERARLEIVYVLKRASRVRIPLSPYFAKASADAEGYGGHAGPVCRSFSEDCSASYDRLAYLLKSVMKIKGDSVIQNYLK